MLPHLLFKLGMLQMTVRPVFTSLAWFAGHTIPPSTCKKVVSQPKVVSELLDTLIRLRAENVKRLLKESGSGASSSFNRNAHGSTYMPRTFLQMLPTAYLLAKVPLQL